MGKNQKQRQSFSGFTLIEIIIVTTLLSIIVGIGIMLINPDRIIRRSNDGSIRAAMAKIINTINYFEAVEDRYPNCEELLEWGDGLREIEECTGADDLSVTFSVQGVPIHKVCDASMSTGQGNQDCLFHYNNSGDSPYVYVRTWEFQDMYFCWNPEHSEEQIQISADRTCTTF